MSAQRSSRLRTSRDSWAYAVLVLAYLGLRALNLWELWLASSHQAATGPANPEGRPSEYFVHTPAPAAPGLSGVLANWDGQWYERIATDGYPTAAESRSANDRWTWAFPPLFPLVARLVMALTGLGFPIAAVVLNLTLGLVATLLLFSLLRPYLGTAPAFAVAVAFNTFMTAPLLTVAYSEPAALVLLLLALRATVARRYALALLGVLVLAFTRPIAVPFAAVFAAHAFGRWRGRRTDPFGLPARMLLMVGVVVSLASPFLWNAVSAHFFAATPSAVGSPDGSGVSRTTSMLDSFDFGWAGGLTRVAGVGGALLALTVLALGLTVADVAARRLHMPAELRVWAAVYVVFVLVVTPVTPGFLRYLLLAAPLLVGVQVVPASWENRAVGILAVGVLTAVALWSQWFWIRYLYILDPAPDLMPWPP